jgi:thermitase
MSEKRLLVLAVGSIVVFTVGLYLLLGAMTDHEVSGIEPSNNHDSGGSLVTNLNPFLSSRSAAETSLPHSDQRFAELERALNARGALPNEAVLIFKTGAAYHSFLVRAASQGIVVKSRLDERLAVRVGFDHPGRLEADMASHSEDYQSAGANFAVSVPSMPSRLQHTGAGEAPFGDSVLSAIGADQNADRSKWGSGVTVAVLDSGVGSHPAFFDGQVIHVDLVNDGKPFNGHGTAMASLIAGNVGGAQGVAPATTILDVRIADATGVSDSFMLAKGIETAVNRGAQIINISMGSYGDSSLVAQAVLAAQQQGVLIVASAGNEQASSKDWPAAYSGVISVSGVDAKGQLAYFSNSGNPTIAAPAVGIPSAYFQDGKPYLAQGDGTSQAAALVSGAAATLKGWGIVNVASALINNARQINATPQDVGAGMLSVVPLKH